MDANHLAQLDQEWRHAEEYIGHFVQISSAAQDGPEDLIRLLRANPAWSVLVMKACAMVEAQCLINAIEREKFEESGEV